METNVKKGKLRKTAIEKQRKIKKLKKRKIVMTKN